MDRAWVVTSAIFHVVGQATRARYAGDETAIAGAKAEVEALLRQEFHEIQEATLNDE
jgi:hypothetical protein